jgi:hypothetical protein
MDHPKTKGMWLEQRKGGFTLGNNPKDAHGSNEEIPDSTPGKENASFLNRTCE